MTCLVPGASPAVLKLTVVPYCQSQLFQSVGPSVGSLTTPGGSGIHRVQATPDLGSVALSDNMGDLTQPLDGEIVVVGGSRSKERIVPLWPTVQILSQSTTAMLLSWLS